MEQTGGAFSEIPPHLRIHIATQRPELYTPMDHAGWRFILKLSQHFFKDHAHEKYLRGLEETGIHTEQIPLISEIDEKLRRFGWRAVPVSGFIPPGAFMEFFALGVLPIACEMRTLEHLAYTPAPDIVHEAAGHAPILADPEYARYLRSYGELARKAIYSSEDLTVYNAIRRLSDIKENPLSTPTMIAQAERALKAAIDSITFVSEATQVSRMGWWTFEYGLVGDLQDPKIYGAGLLSSVQESFHCLGPQVPKIPFSLEVIGQDFDITKPQPQLFVAQDFQVLENALEELSQKMSFRMGGLIAIERARSARALSTTVFDSGLQISGMLESFRTHESLPCFLKYSGPCQLSFEDHELPDQGPPHHPMGFSTPLGPLKNFSAPLTALTEAELRKAHFIFASGIEVKGSYVKHLKRAGKNLFVQLKNCRVTLGGETLFDPSWGSFDLACGERVISVFGDAADRSRFAPISPDYLGVSQNLSAKTNLTPANLELNELYSQVRDIRQSGHVAERASELFKIVKKLEQQFPLDWLLTYEIFELSLIDLSLQSLKEASHAQLKNLALLNPDVLGMLQRGFSSLDQSF